MSTCRRLIVSAILVVLATAAAAWEAPSHWTDLGTVDEWLERDVLFYRQMDALPFVDRSQEKFDQVRIYEGTRTYEGSVAAIGLEAFLALPEDEQAARVREAARPLRQVTRFRDRIDTYVFQTRSQQSVGWGSLVSDITTLGDMLRHLRTAVGLDPSNPHAWHLLAFFATAAGDEERALGALDRVDAALARVPAGELQAMRSRVALDRAWILRGRGDFAGAQEALTAATTFEAPAVEVVLLRGLLAARTGDTQTAVDAATGLRSTDVKSFPPNLRSTSFSPELSNVGAWRTYSSSFLQNWIMALVWLEDGDLEMARNAFGEFPLDDIFPFAWRFWNDAGLIYDMTGRYGRASRAWLNARMWVPYSPYFPMKGYAAELGRLTGRQGRSSVYLGFDRFFMAGNRLVHGWMMLEAMDGVEDEMERQGLASRALDELEICRAAGIYPAQAAVLQGAVFHRMGDLQSAVIEVEEALAILAEQGDGPGYRAIISELANVRHEATDQDIQAFFSQSGTQQSRWASPEDLEAKRASLQAAYDQDPSDENRRDLARFVIRNHDPAIGRELVQEQAATSAPDMELVLEADRALGESARALQLAAGLATDVDPYNDAAVWILVGFMSLDAGDAEAGERALLRALELDPGNHALKIQIQLMRGPGGN